MISSCKKPILVMLAVLLFCGGAYGAVVSTVQSGLWDDANTWDDIVPPDSADDAYILDGHHVIVTNLDAACDELRVPSQADAEGYVTVSNGMLILTNTSYIGMSSGSHGELTLVSNGVYRGFTPSLQVGYSAGSTGILNLVSGSMQWPLGKYFNVGVDGYGKMIVSGGSNTVGRFTVGSGAGYGELIVSGGYCGFYNYSGVGSASGGTGVVFQSGGFVEGVGGAYGITIGAGASHAEYTITNGVLRASGINVGGNNSVLNVGGNAVVTNSGTIGGGDGTGTVIQTGGTFDNSSAQIWIGRNNSGEYRLEGGTLKVSSWRFGGTDSRLTVSGGSMECLNASTYGYGEPATIQIIGAGCTNISFGGLLDYDDGDGDVNKLRAFVDNSTNGVSTMKINGNADFNNVLLEIGLTNDCDCAIGDKFELIRATSLGSSGMVVSNLNLDDGWEFGASADNYSGYDWLIITCLKRPPKATAIMIK